MVKLLDKWLLALAMAADSGLSRAELAAGLWLLERFNVEDGCSWISHGKLGERIGVHRITVMKSVRRLVEAGYFEIVHGGGTGRGDSARYRPVLKSVASTLPFNGESVAPTQPFPEGESVASRHEKRNVQAQESVAPTLHTTGYMKPLKTPLRERERSPKATRLAEGTLLPDDWKAWAIEQGHPDPDREWARFHDYWIAQPGQKALKANWQATWRNWIRRDMEGARDNGKQRLNQSDRPRSPHATLFDAGAAVARRSRS